MDQVDQVDQVDRVDLMDKGKGLASSLNEHQRRSMTSIDPTVVAAAPFNR